MLKMKTTDLLIIGSGPGGYPTAVHAARNGFQTVVIEAESAGGTCLNCGCIPTKTLCRSAEVAETLREAESYGMADVSFRLDFQKAMERKRTVVESLRNGVETLMQTPGITFIKGCATFKDAHTVEVNGEEISAKNIIIATGSKPKMPPIKGIKLNGVVSSTELLEIEKCPERLCIVGAGVIGMEFASVFAAFGSKVTVVEFQKECIPTLDSDIAKRLRQCIAKRGVEFHMQSAVSSIAETTDEAGKRQLSVSFEKKGKPDVVDADLVLIATGRQALTDGLCIENAGIETCAKGISVDDNFMTTADGIYAVGDVNGLCQLAHAATFQGMHVVNHLLGHTDNIDLDIVPSAIFTYPEAASVGLTEEQCKEKIDGYACRKAFYRANGKALAMNETNGMLKLLSSADGAIVGCHVFGAHAADIVQEVAALMNRETTVQQLADIIHIHPTLSEILHSAALQ